MRLLSVIIPVYNEVAVIGLSLKAVEDYLTQQSISYEIIVINDGSTDQTLAKIKSYQSTKLQVVTYQENMGKGYAVNQGMRLAKGDYILMMDADLSTDIDEISSFLKYLNSKPVDVLVGNRHYQSIFKQQRPWWRALYGKIFAGLCSMILGCFLDDLTCGFKMFSKQARDIIINRQRIFRWAFDSEMILIAQYHGLSIAQLPVRWQHHQNSKVKVVKAISQSLMDIIKIRYFALKGFYQ